MQPKPFTDNKDPAHAASIERGRAIAHAIIPLIKQAHDKSESPEYFWAAFVSAITAVMITSIGPAASIVISESMQSVIEAMRKTSREDADTK